MVQDSDGLTDLSQPDDFPVPPHKGPSLTEMGSPLPEEPKDVKLDLAAADASSSIGEWKSLTGVFLFKGKKACLADL